MYDRYDRDGKLNKDVSVELFDIGKEVATFLLNLKKSVFKWQQKKLFCKKIRNKLRR